MLRAVVVAAAAFAAAPALADERPAVAGAGDPAAVFDWTGFYAGVFGGYAAAASTVAVRTPAGTIYTGSPDGPAENTFGQSGWLAGMQAGYLSQMGQFVLGAEGDVALADLDAPFAPFTSGFPGDDYRVSISALASARIKAGIAFDRVLVFATAGVAAGHVHTEYQASPLSLFDYAAWQAGWTGGAGVSVAVSGNVVLTGEYRYADLGRSSGPLLESSAVISHATTDTGVHTGTIGIALKFD